MNKNNIKKIRKSLGYTQADLAREICTFSGACIGQYERFKRIPGVYDIAWPLIRLAKKNGKNITLEDIYPE